MFLEGFSALENNAVIFPQRAIVHPVRCDGLLKIVMTVWHTFLNSNLLEWVWQPAADYNGPFHF
jgi:hypothetical protein